MFLFLRRPSMGKKDKFSKANLNRLIFQVNHEDEAISLKAKQILYKIYPEALTTKEFYSLQYLPSHHIRGITKLKFHPYDNLLILGDYRGVISFWETNSFECILERQAHQTIITNLDISSDGKFLATSGMNKISIWEIQTGKHICDYTVKRRNVWKLYWGYKDNFLVYCDANINRDGSREVEETNQVHIIDIETGRYIKTFKRHIDKRTIFNFAYCPQTNMLTTARFQFKNNRGGCVEVWDLLGEKLLHILRFKDYYISGMAFNHKGTKLATSHKYACFGEVKLWDLNKNCDDDKRCLKIINPEEQSFSTAFTKDDKYLLTAGGYHYNTVGIWELATQKCVYRFPGHGAGVYHAAFNSDASKIAFTSNNPASYIQISNNFSVRICTKL